MNYIKVVLILFVVFCNGCVPKQTDPFLDKITKRADSIININHYFINSPPDREYFKLSQMRAVMNWEPDYCSFPSELEQIIKRHVLEKISKGEFEMNDRAVNYFQFVSNDSNDDSAQASAFALAEIDNIYHSTAIPYEVGLKLNISK
ncbi:MAG: hypothetical protein JEZ07_17505 [Phycisphaerae bacterium]|nr:hypothetical protein [Phycisphaerae bacterium]